jgi:hypothetical protein
MSHQVTKCGSRLCSNRKSRLELLSASVPHSFTTKSDGVCFFPLCSLLVGTLHPTIGLFRPLKWAARSLSRARERMRVGVGILGQGHTPHGDSSGVMKRASHGVCQAREAGPRWASASGRSQTSRVRRRTVRACVPSQAQAVARRSSHRHRTPAVGVNGRDASAMRTRTPCR